MRKKKMNLNSLRRLVKETISETRKRGHKVNQTRSKKKRDQIINEVIDDTVRLLRLFENLEDANMEDDVDDSNTPNAPANTGETPTEDTGTQGAGQTANPYSELVQKILGPPNNSDGSYNKDSLSANAGLPLKTAKKDMKTLIKKFIQDNGGQDGLNKYAKKASDALDKIDFNYKILDVPASECRASQTEVFMNQSVDGFVTRGATFLSKILGAGESDGILDADSVWVSNDTPNPQIIDGHHRTGSAIAANPKAKMKVTVMDANITACLKILNMLLEINAGGSAKVASGKSGDIFSVASKPSAVKAVWEGCTGRSGQDDKKAAKSAIPGDDNDENIKRQRKEWIEQNGGGGGAAFAPHTGRWRTKAATDAYRNIPAEHRGEFMDELDVDGAETPQGALDNWFKDCVAGAMGGNGEITPRGSQGTPDMDTEPGGQGQFSHWPDAREKYGNNVDAFAWHCAFNLNGWKAPADQFPKRENMPQLDGKAGANTGKASDVEKQLKDQIGADGGFDWNAPHQMGESVDLKRWAKLAGIIKG